MGVGDSDGVGDGWGDPVGEGVALGEGRYVGAGVNSTGGVGTASQPSGSEHSFETSGLLELEQPSSCINTRVANSSLRIDPVEVSLKRCILFYSLKAL